MRLMKLLAYAILGYLIYELWQGMKEGEPGQYATGRGQGRQGAIGGRRGSEDLNRALNEDTGRMMNMTGTGRGTTVQTEDDSGTTMPHVVGRGVTRP